MTSGPLGGPRPLTDVILIADFDNMEMKIAQVGPMGVPRPFAKPNPEVSEDRVRECMMSEAGISFGLGFQDIDYNDFRELSPEARVQLLQQMGDLTRSWCEGILGSTSIPELEEAEASELYETIMEQEFEQAMDELEELGDGESQPDVIDV